MTTEIDGATEHEIKIQLSSTTQVKLFASMRSQELAHFADTLKGMFGLADYTVNPENRKNVTDDYYDTSSLTLFRDHSLLRVRRDGGNPKIVAKSMLSQAQGEFKRSEYQQESSEPALQSEIVNNFHTMALKAFPDLTSAQFEHVLKVTNERHNYLVEKPGEKYRLSLDVYFFTNPKTGRTSNQLFEVEVEALTHLASQKIGNIKGNLARALGRFSYSHDSKFETGVKRMRIDRPNWSQWIFEAGQTGALSWTSLIVGIAGLLVGVIGTWATMTD
ncbi:CYTH domain-containing protein [Stenotrophomonas nitritireducens]|uniref:CYTH domain-containing protein n=1 Tax=Stenotrophomonas nitritireducens TaxID=83617 RepID=UPI003D9591AA